MFGIANILKHSVDVLCAAGQTALECREEHTDLRTRSDASVPYLVKEMRCRSPLDLFLSMLDLPTFCKQHTAHCDARSVLNRSASANDLWRHCLSLHAGNCHSRNKFCRTLPLQRAA